MAILTLNIDVIRVGQAKLVGEQYVASVIIGNFPPIVSDVSDTGHGAVYNLMARINNNFDRAHLAIALEVGRALEAEGSPLDQLTLPLQRAMGPHHQRPLGDIAEDSEEDWEDGDDAA